MTDFWDKPITADGATASPEQQAEAWRLWLRRSEKSASGLAADLRTAGVVGTAQSWPTHRVADRMLQKARKGGAVCYVNGRWEMLSHD